VAGIRSRAGRCYNGRLSDDTRYGEVPRAFRSRDDGTVIRESGCRAAVELWMCVIIAGMIRVLDGRVLGTVCVRTSRPLVVARLCAHVRVGEPVGNGCCRDGHSSEESEKRGENAVRAGRNHKKNVSRTPVTGQRDSSR
jgi:hypothetical protein